MTVSELSVLYPSIPWLEYFNKLLSPILKIDPNELINVKEPKFIAGLEKILFLTPRRVLANYAIWRVVRDSVGYLDEEVRRRQLEYWTEVTGTIEREPRFVFFISL